MPPGRSAKHLYPVCLKGYITDYWLSRHIDLDYPQYYHRLATQKRSTADSLAKPGASFTTRTANNTTLKGSSMTPRVLFFATIMRSMTLMPCPPLPRNFLPVMGPRISWNLKYQTPSWPPLQIYSLQRVRLWHMYQHWRNIV